MSHLEEQFSQHLLKLLLTQITPARPNLRLRQYTKGKIIEAVKVHRRESQTNEVQNNEIQTLPLTRHISSLF